MDHQDSEHSSEIKTDLSSNQAEKSAKTIHQKILKKMTEIRSAGG
jgi:hypothetical protein